MSRIAEKRSRPRASSKHSAPAGPSLSGSSICRAGDSNGEVAAGDGSLGLEKEVPAPRQFELLTLRCCLDPVVASGYHQMSHCEQQHEPTTALPCEAALLGWTFDKLGIHEQTLLAE